jgi:hypothetical protein
MRHLFNFSKLYDEMEDGILMASNSLFVRRLAFYQLMSVAVVRRYRLFGRTNDIPSL